MRVSPLFATFQVASSASVDELWRKVVNLADVSWHPMLSSTNVPQGLIPKPGLIYQAVTRFSPFPIRIFVERVDHRERLSFRIMAVPGVEERVTYQVESTVWGTRVSYSVTLKGWLSPLIWSFVRPHAAQVAAALVQAAETAATQRLLPRVPGQRKRPKHNFHELLNIAMLAIGLFEWV
ncbi:MAG: SRPBCC family protein [Leptolyngbyaceae bacterium]|nr:SRPBCC family protein [Leptolyngbyaceae bacterium]